MGKLSWKIVGTSIHMLWKLQVCRVANTCHYKVDVKDNWNSEWEWLEIVPHSNTHSIT